MQPRGSIPEQISLKQLLPAQLCMRMCGLSEPGMTNG